MTVRRYMEADFAAVCRIYGDAKRDELAPEDGPFDVVPLAEDRHILAAFNESDVLVFAGPGILGFSATFEGQLRALFVERACRSQGVGGALLKAVLASAAGGLSLNVAKSNVKAKEFYRRNGFVVAGEFVTSYGGREVVYERMARDA